MIDKNKAILQGLNLKHSRGVVVFLCLLCSLVVVLIAQSAQAHRPLNLPESDSTPYLQINGEKVQFERGEAIQVPQYAQFAEDKYAQWTPEDVFLGLYDNTFFDNDSLFGNFSFTDSAYWMSFDIDWERSNVLDELIFVINAATLDEVSLFVQADDGQIIKKISGYRKPKSTQDIPHHNYVFHLNPHDGKRFLVRGKSNTSLIFPLEIWNYQDFYLQNYADVILIGAYFGVLLIMFFYNLFIYISTRDRSYLFYILFILSYGGLQTTLDGSLGYWIWGESTTFRGYDLMFFSALSAILSLLFSAQFLNAKETNPWLFKIMISTAVLLGFCFVLSVITDGAAIKLVAYLSLWTTILLFCAGLIALRAGQPGAEYFVFAWLFLILGTVAYLLGLFGLYHNMDILVYSMKLGSSLEVVLLSLGLADRMNRERREKEILETERVELKSKAQMMASVDTRTGMPNRAQLQQQLDIYSKSHMSFSLILLKVMGFKRINNTLGHENGDELLKLLALKIDSVFSDGSIPIFTVGNNAEGVPSDVAVVDSLTFAAIVNEAEPGRLENVALNLKEQVSGTIEFKNVMLDLEILIGVTTNVGTQPKNSERIVHEAQVGMAAANKFEQHIGVYSPLIDPYSEDQLSLMGLLRQAVLEEGLDVYFQPQLDIETLQLIGFESLLRWKDANGRYIDPGSFIPLAESCGVIRPLTRWVIKQSLMRLAEVQVQVPEAQVSINLSVSNLREDDLVAYIRDQLKVYGLEARRVKFEITESSMIENEELALNRLLQLRRLGCLISIDDYGSGYASLGYLKQLPISEVKIDRSFVQDLAANHDDQVIVKATIAMCHDLGLKVVAEGVENEEGLALLKNFGCDTAQGFLLARPAPYSRNVVDEWCRCGDKFK